MNRKSVLLRQQARAKMGELSRHPVLATYWPRLSLVLKGSTARGNADRYSDIDLVFYATDEVKKSVVSGYRAQGLTDRTDGIFFLFDNGHYHIESYGALEKYFAQKDFIRCWDAEHGIVLHDPAGRFAKIIKAGQRQLFADHLEIVKRAYLDLQLDLDWMRMPIIRADGTATFLHAAKLVQGLCRIAYLLDKKSYPPDKWVARYLPTTALGRAQGKALRRYVGMCHQVNSLVAHRPFAEHPLYREAAIMIDQVGRFIAKRHGRQAWNAQSNGQWYNYV